MIYFDNAATSSFKPEGVFRAIENTMRFANANPGRGAHEPAMKASRIVSSARADAAGLFGLSNTDCCVFTGGCTLALNTAIFGIQKKGRIVTTALEHNSVLRPINRLSLSFGIPVHIIRPDENGVITVDAVRRRVTPDTGLVAVTHVSNVLGTENPIREIAGLCRERGVPLLSDCAQSAGHKRINMDGGGPDIVAAAGHKGLLGPQGVGLLLFSEKVTIRPFVYGGTGVDSINPNQTAPPPEGLEAGTLPVPIIAGLNAGINYVKEHFPEIAEKTAKLGDRLYERLRGLSKIEIYSPPETGSGIVAFNIKGASSSAVADRLSVDYGIAVRGGMHCAPLVHEHLGTIGRGAVRASLSFKNTAPEIDCFVDAVREIARSY